MSAKIEQLTRLTLRPGQWSERFHDMAQGIPHDDPAPFLASLMEKFRSGKAHYAEVAAPSGVVGFVAYALAFAGREFVVVAVYARDGQSLALELDAQLLAFARSLGCFSIRFHTMRPGLVRRAVEEGGYHVGEIILRKSI